MAEFHFYGTKKDWPVILQRVLAVGKLAISADRVLPGARYRSFAEYEPALIESLALNGVTYVTGEFSYHGLRHFIVDEGPQAGTRLVSATESGPYLTLALPVCRRRPSDKWHMAPGSLFIATRVFDPLRKTNVPTSEEMKTAYRQCVHAIKSAMTRIKKCHNVWVAQDGLRLLDSGEAILLYEGKWWDRQGSYVKSNIHRAN